MLLDRLFSRWRRTDDPSREPSRPSNSGVRRTSDAGKAPAAKVPAEDRSDGQRLGVVDTEAGFDPYNSGAFVKKAGAWERVNRR